MRRSRNLPILVGLGASLLLHAGAIVLILRNATGVAEPVAMPARLQPDEIAPRDPPPTLGLEEARESLTLTWVGYTEYEEHLARLADFEQAAFRADPVSLAPAPEDPESPATAPPPGEHDDPAPPAQAAASLSEDDVRAIMDLLDRLREDGAPEPVAPRPSNEEQAADTLTEWLDTLEAALRKEPAPPSGVPSSDAPTPATPAPVPAPAPTKPEPGDAAEKEADATSVVDVALDEIRPGKPLARRGLELMPRRPRFTALLKQTAAPDNPLVLIKFDADGKPDEAAIVVSSGDPRVDHAILSSLYRWRAKGKPLSALTGDETVEIRIRLILSRHRR